MGLIFEGWLAYAGNEIVNSARATSYAHNLMSGFNISDCYDCGDLGLALGDGVYVSPEADDAPWFDPDEIASSKFMGAYPLSMTGFTDSTRTASAFESILDGGFLSRVRRKTREMRVTGMLIGTDDEGAEYGMSWLRSALYGSLCDDNGCSGDEMCFLIDCPTPDISDTQLGSWDRVVRRMRSVTCTSGPLILQKSVTASGGVLIQFEVFFVAGVPHIYGQEKVIFSGRASGQTPPTGTYFPLSAPLENCFRAEPPPSNIFDPDCPPPPRPPAIPALPSACGSTAWSGYGYNPQPQSQRQIATGGFNANSYSAVGPGTTILTIYDSDPKVIDGPASRVFGATSINNGSTWAAPFLLYDNKSVSLGSHIQGLTYAAAVGGRAAKYLAVFADGSAEGYDSRAFLSQSPSGLPGTWAAVGELDSVIRAAGFTIGYRVSDLMWQDSKTPNGLLYLSASGRVDTNSNYTNLLLRSSDLGATWSKAAFPLSTNPSFPAVDGVLVQWKDAEIGVLTHTGRVWYPLGSSVAQYSRAHLTRSRNYGETWGSAAEILAGLGVSGRRLAAQVASEGTLLIGYSDRSQSNGLLWAPWRTAYSRDRGASWTRGNTTTFGRGAMARGSFVRLNNGNMGLSFSAQASAAALSDVVWLPITQVVDFFSYALFIPPEEITDWKDTVINLQLRTGQQEVRQTRIRFLPAVPGATPADVSPCDICGEFLISYIPPNTVATIDGLTEQITMQRAGQSSVQANHLVTGVGTERFQFPLLTCGTGYYAFIDMDKNALVDASLSVATRE